MLLRMISPTLRLLLLLVPLVWLTKSGIAYQEKTISLNLVETNLHDAILTRDAEGAYEIRTTGSDPYIFTEPFTTPQELGEAHVLAFEYFSTTGTNLVQVFLDPPVSEARSVSAPGLSNSEGWSRYAVDLKPAFGTPPGKIRRLRIDLGSHAGKVIRIRSLMLRPLSEQEKQLAARRATLRESERQQEGLLRKYLDRSYPGQITRVAVNDTTVEISGEISRPPDTLFLAEMPLSMSVVELKDLPGGTPLHPDSDGKFTVRLPRRNAGKGLDRLLSRWAIVRRSDRGFELLSHAHYADTVAPKWVLPDEKPRNKKGIGGFSAHGPVSDLDELAVAAVTVNIVLNGIISSTPGTGKTAFVYGEHTYYTDDRAVEGLDQTLRAAAQRHLIVSAIILLGQPGNAPVGDYRRRIAHPDADPAGIFVMPNVIQDDGVEAYAASLDFLARRYGQPDNRYGRIHHWILHNEINAGWVWTNAGEKNALPYMDLYQKSMRIAYLIARQYNLHARPFISLEHHWGAPQTAHLYSGRELLDLLVDFSRAEGDFEWSIAFHPYPQNLFNPRVWEDNEVDFTLATPKITFKNLEVLDAWVKQPRTFYRGKTPRIIHLTEQGLNSPDYSEKSLRDQAAGMAYAWNKFKNMDSVEVFDYHNWIDNRGEGGLRIGLHRFPDDPEDPLGRKPIWWVYQALGTGREADATEAYKSVVGVKDWSEVRHKAP